MINMTFPASADGAANYYGKSGSELESVGSFKGNEAKRLGISGSGDLDTFRSMLHNRMPDGSRMTPRDRHDRRPMLDITVSPSKSVAVMAAMYDPRIKAEIVAANDDTMRLIQRKGMTRVMRMKRQEKVTTGSLVWIDFMHEITRSRDPGFHIHNAVLPVTTVNGKPYSVEFNEIAKSLAFYKAAFHSNLAHRMQKLGYETYATKDAFELACVPKRVIREFSKRREDINDEAARRNIRSPKGRAAIAAYTRSRKRDDLRADKLFAEWIRRLTPEEHKRMGSATRKALEASQDAVELPNALKLETTLETLLKATSAVAEEVLLTETMKRHPGEVTLEGLLGELQKLPITRAEVDGIPYVTTPDAMKREKEIVTAARNGAIRVKRTKRGESVPVRDKEVLVPEADKLTLEKLYSLVQEGNPLLLHSERNRDYRKPARGEPLAFLEDIAGLSTGQQRPGLVSKAIRVSGQVLGKVKRQLDRVRRFEFVREIQQEGYGHGEHTRQAGREPERGWSR